MSGGRFALLALALASVGCSTETPVGVPATLAVPPVADRQLAMTSHVLTLTDGSELPYDRGVLTVPSRRGIAGSPSIPVEFYRFFGPEQGAGPPILRIMGGPGWTGAGERVDRPGWAEFYVLPLTAAADLVIMGQRGFGASSALECDDPPPLSIEQALSREERVAARSDAIRSCRAQHVADGVDIEGFSVPEMAADSVEVARSLGYETFQVLGTSFGSHVAMALLRMYPDVVEQATLNALEGPDHTYDRRAGQWEALERIVASAKSDSERGIDGNPLHSFRDLIEQSRDEPIEVELTLSGEDWEDVLEPGEVRNVTVQLGPAELASLPFLSSTNFSFRWPRWMQALQRVAGGEMEDEVEELLWRWVHPRIDDPAELELDCGSGVSPQRLAELSSDPATDWLGAHAKLGACAAWGNPDLGAAFRGDFETAIPVLLIHGDHDTSTPIDNALELLPSFSDRHFIWVSGGSHGALVEAFDESGFVEGLQRWLRSGERSHLPRVLTVASPF